MLLHTVGETKITHILGGGLLKAITHPSFIISWVKGGLGDHRPYAHTAIVAHRAKLLKTLGAN